jgi:hypothetical protein
MARLSSSGWKVRKLVETHVPAPPAARPHEGHRIRWDDIVTLVMKVYELRSNAVHAGLPFPAPLLDPPHDATQPPPEASKATMGAGNSVWTKEDMPMYLHVFADVVGEPSFAAGGGRSLIRVRLK